MSAKTRLAHIKALGFTIDQEMIDRENRIDEAAQVRICNEMVAEVAPMLMTLRSAIAGTYIVDDEQAADAEWLGEPDTSPTYTESELTRQTKAEAANRKPWPKYGYTGADSKGTVDVSDIPAYSTHKPHRGKSYDQHESHAWTVDGE